MGQQGHHDHGSAVAQEGRQELVQAPDPADGTDQELPHEHHHAAGDQTGQNALAVAALPEQGEQNGGAEGGAKACPGEGHDGEHRAVGVCGQEHGDDSNDDDGQPGHQHGLLGAQLDAKDILKQVLGEGRGGSQQLGVRRGHGCCQNTGQDHTGHDGRQDAELGQQACDLDDDRLGSAALQCRDAASLGDGIADHADADGNGHGDDHPHGGDPAAEGQLLLVADSHEADQNVGHTEVSQTPGQHGEDIEEAIGLGGVGHSVVSFKEAEVAGHRLCIGHHHIQTAGLMDAKGGDDHQGHRHDDRLDQIHGGNGGETAHGGIADDDHSADDHSQHVIPAEQAVEQLSDGRQTGGHIGHEENQDHQRGDAHDDGLLLPIAFGDEGGDGDGVQLHAVAADALGHQQEVQIGAQSQADGGPAGVGHTGQVGNTGQAHQQPGGHVAGLGAHGRDQGAHAAAAQIKALRIFFASASDHHAGEDHEAQIQDDHRSDADLCASHNTLS